MASVADRVSETATAPGTGNVTLLGAATNFRTFSSAFPLNIRLDYCIENGSSWEVGIGYLSASATLVRDVVLSSSNSGSLVNFTGSCNVFCTASADTLDGATYGHQLAIRNGLTLP